MLVYIDDATGKLLHPRFASSENTFDYLQATKSDLEEWGIPLAFYSEWETRIDGVDCGLSSLAHGDPLVR